jgi:Holliday junction resolvasome RuvABC endonuclease subunit
MIKISIKKLERKLNFRIKPNIKVLGLDLASRTGYCIITTTKYYVNIDYSFINIQTKDIHERYYYMTKIFNEIIKPEYDIVIEDTFLKWNANAFKFLSRLGGIVYSICYFKKVKNHPIFMYASSARKNLGIKGNCKKEGVFKYLKTLGLSLKDEDICDAIVLALNGIIGESLEGEL